MVKNNKTCILCGKKYSYCNSCAEFDHLPRWMEIYCTANCKDIFNILSSYNMKHKTKEEARTLLEKCDLSYVTDFNHINQKFIEEIMEKESMPILKENDIESQIHTPDSQIDIEIESSHEKPQISDPVIDVSISKPKRMKYTNKKNN